MLKRLCLGYFCRANSHQPSSLDAQPRLHRRSRFCPCVLAFYIFTYSVHHGCLLATRGFERWNTFYSGEQGEKREGVERDRFEGSLKIRDDSAPGGSLFCTRVAFTRFHYHARNRRADLIIRRFNLNSERKSLKA